MLTRREKLLIRPWQLRRYNNHKKRVVNAVSVIDFGPPVERNHVMVKFKKLQKENDRQRKIEEDNFRLLQHLSTIMNTKRVDNQWETKPPKFLRRVSIYPRTRTPSPFSENLSESTTKNTTTRKSKCCACTPGPEKIISIPEERVPWNPPKKSLNRRQSDHLISSDLDISLTDKSQVKKREFVKTRNLKEKRAKKDEKNLNSKENYELPEIMKNKNLAKSNKRGQRVILKQGPTQVIINFPIFAEVKLIQGKTEKYLQHNYCEYKSLQSTK